MECGRTLILEIIKPIYQKMGDKGRKIVFPFLICWINGRIDMSLRPETSSGEKGTDVSTFPGGMILDEIMTCILQNHFRSFPKEFNKTVA